VGFIILNCHEAEPVIISFNWFPLVAILWCQYMGSIILYCHEGVQLPYNSSVATSWQCDIMVLIYGNRNIATRGSSYHIIQVFPSRGNVILWF